MSLIGKINGYKNKEMVSYGSIQSYFQRVIKGLYAFHSHDKGSGLHTEHICQSPVE